MQKYKISKGHVYRWWRCFRSFYWQAKSRLTSWGASTSAARRVSLIRRAAMLHFWSTALAQIGLLRGIHATDIRGTHRINPAGFCDPSSPCWLCAFAQTLSGATMLTFLCLYCIDWEYILDDFRDIFMCCLAPPSCFCLLKVCTALQIASVVLTPFCRELFTPKFSSTESITRC